LKEEGRSFPQLPPPFVPCLCLRCARFDNPIATPRTWWFDVFAFRPAFEN